VSVCLRTGSEWVTGEQGEGSKWVFKEQGENKRLTGVVDMFQYENKYLSSL
jgi:hypothetical protein